MATCEQELKVGFGFRPYDEELVGYFLHHKILGNNHLVEDFISEVDIGSVDPWNLRLKSKIKSRDHICYFFRENKYEDRNRQSRKTPSGKWNITGKPLDVKDQRGIWSEGGGTIGFKKYLRFLKPNSNKNDKSWSMQEFHYTLLPEAHRTYVLCRLEYKGDDKNVILVNPTDPMTNSRGYVVDQPVQGNTGSLNDLPEFDLANERNTGSLNNLPEFDLANESEPAQVDQSILGNSGFFNPSFDQGELFGGELNQQQLSVGTSSTLFNTFSDFGLANQDQPQQLSIEQSVFGNSDISFNNAFSNVMNLNHWFSSNLNQQQLMNPNQWFSSNLNSQQLFEGT